MTAERALELVADFVDRVRDAEEEGAEPLIMTAFLHPPTRRLS